MKRTRTSRQRRVAAVGLLLSAMLATAGLTVGETASANSYPTVSGAGSTWVQIALDQWRADIAQQGFHINFQGVGSSTGRQFYIANQVDFAASEIPFYPSELQQLQSEGKSFQYVPDVAGGTSLMYNLHAPDGSRITTLRLDAETAAKIFTGGITKWQDPAIAALNPGLTISETYVNPVVRSDGSGTSAQFSLYLASQAANVWDPFASQYGCAAPCSVWPAFPGSTAQQGSDGVANFIENNQIGSGAIGYVEAGYAFGRGFPIVRLKNASGNFVPNFVDQKNGPPDFSNDVATALKHATLNSDLTQNLGQVYVAPEANAYPMSSYSYLITQTTGFDPSKGFVLGTWMIYIACAGQQEATPLGYSPLPVNLVQDVFSAVGRIPGAPATPPIDAAHCPNPTITGKVAAVPTPTPAPRTSNGGGRTSSGGGGAPTGTTTATTSSQAAVPGAAASSVSGGLGGGTGGIVGATAVPTLSQVQQQVAFLAGEQEANSLQTKPSIPLLLAALVVLLVVFTPALLVKRRVP